jgi:non-hemolytic enterotoxin B/C
MSEDNVTSTPVTEVGSASRGHASQALIVQAHALSVLQQPLIDVAGFDTLKPIGTNINDRLTISKNHSNHYLDVLLPKMITTVTDIDAYVNVQNALAGALNPQAPKSEAVTLLRAAQEATQDYKRRANELVLDLGEFRGMLSEDASAFSKHASELQVAINGDAGVLKDIDNQLADIDGKIAGAITGVVLSGLAMVGGAFMIAVGSIASFVTAGTSTPLVVAGVAVLTAGIGGEVASAITLATLLDLKAEQFRKQAHLKEEVKLATGLSTGMRTLFESASASATATQEMANAWTLMENHLGNLASNIERGVTGSDAVRGLFQRAAQGDAKNVQNDVQIIYGQLAGIDKIIKPTAQLSLVIVEEARKRAA